MAGCQKGQLPIDDGRPKLSIEYTYNILFDCNVINVEIACRINHILIISGCSGLVVEYRTRNREVTGSTHTRSTASNLEEVANLLCAQANSASYPQRDGK